MASGADVRYAYVAESAFGTTPATPSFQTMRVTSGGLSTTKETVASEQIRSDHNVTDELQVGQSVQGSYPFELSYASFDDLIANALGGAWASDVLKNSTDKSYFTFEETIENGATDTFRRFTGCTVNSLSLGISTRSRITGSFGIVGKQEVLGTDALTGATYADPNDKQIMVSGTSIGTVTVDGVTDNCVQSLSIEVSRNVRPVQCVGSIYASDMNTGMTDVTGSVTLYFKKQTAYQNVLNHGSAAISVTIGHDENEKYTFEIPKARWLDGSLTTGGNNEDVVVVIPFRGVYDAPEDCSIKITRAVA